MKEYRMDRLIRIDTHSYVPQISVLIPLIFNRALHIMIHCDADWREYHNNNKLTHYYRSFSIDIWKKDS